MNHFRPQLLIHRRAREALRAAASGSGYPDRTGPPPPSGGRLRRTDGRPYLLGVSRATVYKLIIDTDHSTISGTDPDLVKPRQLPPLHLKQESHWRYRLQGPSADPDGAAGAAVSRVETHRPTLSANPELTTGRGVGHHPKRAAGKSPTVPSAERPICPVSELTHSASTEPDHDHQVTPTARKVHCPHPPRGFPPTPPLCRRHFIWPAQRTGNRVPNVVSTRTVAHSDLVRDCPSLPAWCWCSLGRLGVAPLPGWHPERCSSAHAGAV